MVRAAIAGVEPAALVRRALQDADVRRMLRGASRVHVIAAGKSAAPMLLARPVLSPPGALLGIGPVDVQAAPPGVEWRPGGHPLPDEQSVVAAGRALAIARAATGDDLLLLLLSGGASAMMAAPADNVSLDDKRAAIRSLLEAGAGIEELNTVRKHLSRIKGGQLAAGTAASVLTLAISDVVGDDPSVIGSGPTVADASTFADALSVIERHGGEGRYPAAVVARLRRGAAGAIPETPKPGAPALRRATTLVIGSARDALDAASHEARALGYRVHVVMSPTVGEARAAARPLMAEVMALAATGTPLCVLASGETTVTVRGSGRGGRNQELSLGLARVLAGVEQSIVAASIGTDGIDGPTDAAGAVADPTTIERAARAGLDVHAALDNNDTYRVFDRLGDLIRTGPTGANVGDLQVVLVDAARRE